MSEVERLRSDLVNTTKVDSIREERDKKNSEFVNRCLDKAEKALDEAATKVAWPDNANALVNVSDSYRHLATAMREYG